MGIAEPPEELEVRAALREERQRLVESLDELRGEIDEVTDVRAQLEERIVPVLPVALLAAFAVGFVLAGGIGATVRLVLRVSREGRVKARAGPLALVVRR
jgi:hypothetical protein